MSQFNLNFNDDRQLQTTFTAQLSDPFPQLPFSYWSSANARYTRLFVVEVIILWTLESDNGLIMRGVK